ncbi:hypothetical protein U1Q18_023057 [Sarracenia purpurea var. burkii]
MYDGVWCMNKRLVVKRAWWKKTRNRDWSQPHVQGPNMKEKKSWPPTPEQTVIDAEDIDEDWLKLCVVGIVKEYTELCSIQTAMDPYGVRLWKSTKQLPPRKMLKLAESRSALPTVLPP